MASLDCDLSTVPDSNFAPLPAGDYQMMVVNDEEKTSAAGTRYVSWTLEVISGEYKGRKIWENLNLYHEKPDVRNISLTRVKSVAIAVGIPADQVKSTEQCLNKPFLATLGVKDDKNNIKKVVPLSSKPVSRPAL
jgi:hypothetical protein